MPSLELVALSDDDDGGDALVDGVPLRVRSEARTLVLHETLRLELNGRPIRVVEIDPGMVRTDEFALKRFEGDADKAAAVYAGVAAPLVAEDIADCLAWTATRPHHVIPLLVSFYKDGRLLLDEMVSQVYPLDQITQALDDLHHGKLNRGVLAVPGS